MLRDRPRCPRQVQPFQETFDCPQAGCDSKVRIIFSARQSHLKRPAERQTHFEAEMARKRVIPDAPIPPQAPATVGENGDTIRARRAARLQKITALKDRRRQQQTFSWANYFHGNPLILQKIKQHYVADGKRVCVQLCHETCELLAKQNFCERQLQLM